HGAKLLETTFPSETAGSPLSSPARAIREWRGIARGPQPRRCSGGTARAREGSPFPKSLHDCSTGSVRCSVAKSTEKEKEEEEKEEEEVEEEGRLVRPRQASPLLTAVAGPCARGHRGAARRPTRAAGAARRAGGKGQAEGQRWLVADAGWAEGRRHVMREEGEEEERRTRAAVSSERGPHTIGWLGIKKS
ncbi:unnamed protein product, partial [Prorocentrum cordatum]